MYVVQRLSTHELQKIILYKKLFVDFGKKAYETRNESHSQKTVYWVDHVISRWLRPGYCVCMHWIHSDTKHQCVAEHRQHPR